jgi:hypothetical protein
METEKRTLFFIDVFSVGIKTNTFSHFFKDFLEFFYFFILNASLRNRQLRRGFAVFGGTHGGKYRPFFSQKSITFESVVRF